MIISIIFQSRHKTRGTSRSGGRKYQLQQSSQGQQIDGSGTSKISRGHHVSKPHYKDSHGSFKRSTKLTDRLQPISAEYQVSHENNSISNYSRLSDMDGQGKLSSRTANLTLQEQGMSKQGEPKGGLKVEGDVKGKDGPNHEQAQFLPPIK